MRGSGGGPDLTSSGPEATNHWQWGSLELWKLNKIAEPQPIACSSKLLIYMKFEMYARRKNEFQPPRNSVGCSLPTSNESNLTALSTGNRFREIVDKMV